MKKILVTALLLIAVIVYAQPPVNIVYSNAESNAATDHSSTTLSTGCLVQVINAGVDGIIQPPVLIGAYKGLPTGDDFVVVTAAIGDNLPPIPPYAGRFVSSGQIFFTATSGQNGVGNTLYFRFFDDADRTVANYFGNSTTYVTTNVNGQTMERTGQTDQLLGLPVPAPITTLSVVLSGGNAVLQWSASNNATGYNIYRTTDILSWSSTPIASVSTTNCQDAAVVNNNSLFFYRVTATN